MSSWERPYGGQGPSGDRHGTHLEPERLTFYLADAAGHGAQGAALWERHGDLFDRAWRELLASPGERADLRRLGRVLNTGLHESSESLCLAIGSLSASGRLVFVSFGFGTHVLPVAYTPWWIDDPERLFGLKLGWLPADRWEGIDRAFVFHEVTDVRRVVLLSDGFLGDDHRDPLGTLATVRELSQACRELPFEQVLPRIRELPHEDDDASALVIDVRCRRTT